MSLLLARLSGGGGGTLDVNVPLTAITVASPTPSAEGQASPTPVAISVASSSTSVDGHLSAAIDALTVASIGLAILGEVGPTATAISVGSPSALVVGDAAASVDALTVSSSAASPQGEVSPGATAVSISSTSTTELVEASPASTDLVIGSPAVVAELVGGTVLDVDVGPTAFAIGSSATTAETVGAAPTSLGGPGGSGRRAGGRIRGWERLPEDLDVLEVLEVHVASSSMPTSSSTTFVDLHAARATELAGVRAVPLPPADVAPVLVVFPASTPMAVVSPPIVVGAIANEAPVVARVEATIVAEIEDEPPRERYRVARAALRDRDLLRARKRAA